MVISLSCGGVVLLIFKIAGRRNRERKCYPFRVFLKLSNFISTGFAVVLLVFHYLQHGCSPPVLPSLQENYPSCFDRRDPKRVADWLEQDYAPPEISTYQSTNPNSLEVLLQGFFQYYSGFNWRQVISVRKGAFIPLPWGDRKKWTSPYIRIEDPYNRTNVTRAVFESESFDKIKRAITTARQRVDRGEKIHDIVS
jgi:poly(A) RNA polymerase GLD2